VTPEQEWKLVEYIDARVGGFEPGKLYQFQPKGIGSPYLVPAEYVRYTGERQAYIAATGFLKNKLGESPAFVLEPKTTICRSGGVFHPTIKVLVDEEVFYLPLASITVTFVAMGGTPAHEAMISFDFERFLYPQPYLEAEEEQ
jgi:hypothetical protein